VTAEQVAAITPRLPSSLEKIGVFVDADFATIAAAVEQSGLTGVQIHSESSADLATQLRGRFGPVFRILRVIHFGDNAAQQLESARADAVINGVLVDSRTATAVGGTGIAFDWQVARETIFTDKSQLKLIAAGGLNPANVAEAIATLRPWGVDVVTGVEASAGHKDAVKVTEFVARARSAGDTLT
jgi:phosphoribosylanthranilate isomerase